MKGALAMSLSAAVVAAAPAAATAAPRPLRFHPFTTARTRAVTDGSRYLAYARRAGLVEVADQSTGGRFDVTVPDGDCWAPEAVGGGMVVMDCKFEPRAELIDIGQRRAFEPAGLAKLARAYPPQGDYGFAFDRVGSSWISGTAYAYHSLSRFYINWRTGELRYPVNDRSVVPDLNSPALMVPVCKPLARLRSFLIDDPYTNANWWFDEDLQYAPPDYLNGVNQLDDNNHPVVVRRCGSRRDKTIGRLADSVQLGAGSVSWLRELTGTVERPRVGVTVNAYRTRGGKVYRKTYPRIARDFLLSLAHTTDRLYLSERVAHGWRIRAAALGRDSLGR